MYKSGSWNVKLDGDCDKIMIISPNGKILKGDLLLTAFALAENESIVTNLLTNNSCFDLLDKHNIKYELAGTGERRLVDAMLKKGYNLCGEKSGNIIWLETKTSDAFVTALKFANIKDEKIVQSVIDLPQVPSKEIKLSLDYEKVNSSKFQTILDEIERDLENNGKIIVRINHLEGEINVYIECKDNEILSKFVQKIQNYLQ